MLSNLLPATTLLPTSTSVSSPSSFFELESQFILRMPTIKENGLLKLHPATKALREALTQKVLLTDSNQTSSVETIVDPLKDRLFINLNTETRKGQIKFDDEIFDARLVDLPCIIESHKTLDKKMMYKIADISQMLVCKTKDDPWHTSDEETIKKKEAKPQKKQSDNSNNDKNVSFLKKYQWPHGLAPPLKNVRRKRFRKVAKKKIIDYADIEKEVKQLFRSDREAFKVDYEVLLVEGELDENNDENKNSDRNNSANNDDDYDDSSQEDCGGIGPDSYMDSAIDNESNKMTKVTSLKRTIKVKNLIEESNMSSAMEDDDSIMATTLTLNKTKQNETDLEDGETTNLNANNFDECSVDNINGNSKFVKQRTGFKDLFVEEVLGDLSSSSDDDEDDEDEEDEENKKNSTQIVKSFKFNLNKNSIHVSSKSKESYTEKTLIDESNSNFEDSNIGFSNTYESDASNLENRLIKPVFKELNLFEDEENRNNLSSALTKNIDILDINSPINEDNEDLSDDTFQKKKDEDFKGFGSSLSSSPTSSNDNMKIKKNELNSKLNKLIDELQKIKDERVKRETEINNINNPGLKAHLSSRLNNLIEEENKKQNEIDDIRSEIDD